VNWKNKNQTIKSIELKKTIINQSDPHHCKNNNQSISQSRDGVPGGFGGGAGDFSAVAALLRR
jgi:hypothetical protein